MQKLLSTAKENITFLLEYNGMNMIIMEYIVAF